MIQSCDQLTDDLLAAYLLGKLPLSELLAVENHFSSCDDCESRAASANPSDKLVRQLIRSKPDPDAATTCHASINQVAESANRSCNENTGLTAWIGQTHVDGLKLPLPAELIGHPRYRIIRLLGRGGMGTVWLAEHLVMRRHVALKVIRPELISFPGATIRFRREVEASAKLNHPNIVAAYDAEQIGDVFFLVMEYVDGKPLTEFIKEGPLAVSSACRVIRDAALGLAHAHAAGLVHRDVKPANILMSYCHEVKVVDFGLVTAMGADSSITTDHIVMGTPDSIAPEQAIDPRVADARSDIYSLGCSLYHLLTGQVPFPDGSMVQKIDAHRYRLPGALSQIPPELGSILSRMLAKKPGQRIQTADEVASSLQAFCGSCESVSFATLADPLPVRIDRASRSRLAALSLLLAILLPFLPLYRPSRESTEASPAIPVEDSLASSIRSPEPGRKRHRPASHFQKHNDMIRRVLFSPDGHTLYSSSDDGWIYVWNIETGALASEISIGDSIISFSIFDEGRELLVVLESGLKRITLADPSSIYEFPPVPQRDRMQNVAVSPDGRRAATTSLARGTVRLWDIATQSLERSWEAGDINANLPYVYDVVWLFDGQRLATAGDAGLSFWDLESGECVISTASNRREHSLAVSGDGQRLFVSGFHDGIGVFNPMTGEKLHEIPNQGWPKIALTPDDRLLVSSKEGVDLWDPISQMKLTQFVIEHPSPVSCVTASLDGHWIACGTADHQVYVWRLPTVEEMISFDVDRIPSHSSPNAIDELNDPYQTSK